MIELGLTAAEEKLLLAALLDSHAIRTTVLVLDRNEKPVSTLTGEGSKLVDGSVQIDSGADVTRSCSLTLFDPDRTLQFDSTSPTQGSLFADRMIAVQYGVWVDALGRYIDIPVFWGPITSFNRNGAFVSVEAMGKESLALGPHFPNKAYAVHKGTRLDDAVRNVMDRLGETRYLIPSMKKKLPVDRAVLKENEPWNVITEQSDGIVKRRRRVKKKDHTVTVITKTREPVPSLLSYAENPTFAFYNGRGQLVVRSTNSNSVYGFKEGVDIVTRPEFSFDISEFRNHVVLRGVESKGRRKNKSGARVEYTIPAPVVELSLDGSHPLAPQNIGRNGKGRYLVEFADAPGLKKRSQVRAKAEKILKGVSTEGLSVSFEALPIPMLEEGDMVKIETESGVVEFRIGQMTIPLVAGTMSVGVNKKVRPKKRSAWA